MTVLFRVAWWLSVVLSVYIVVFHIAAFVLESFLIQSEFASQLLGGTPDGIAVTFAKNQGVYNLVLAMQMAWALLEARRDPRWRLLVHASVAVVGLAGAVTVSGTIALVQMAPGLVAAIATVVEIALRRRADRSTAAVPAADAVERH